MTFRTRLAIAASAAVAVAIALASVVIFVVVRAELRGQVDGALDDLVGEANVLITADAVRVTLPPAAYGGARGYAQVIGPDGAVRFGGGEPLPVGPEAQAVAAGRKGRFFEEVTVGGVHVRVLTTRLPQGLALQVARPLTETDQALRRLELVLGLVAAGGVGLASVLGLVVTRTATGPIRSLMEATEHVTETGDLTRRVDAPGTDEVGRLASSFNAMLEALEGSLAAQRQLVADASHELRTPLTSLRTNIEVLAGPHELPGEDRARLLRDVRTQIEELSTLVADVVEVGRGQQAQRPAEDVRLDLLVAGAIDRAAARWPRVDFISHLEAAGVRGVPERLERAVRNLLDNAANWSPEGEPIEVSARRGDGAGEVAVVVRDHGPGIAPEDLPRVFDRFYRAPAARGTPGSGLGLAIVRQVALEHGGTAEAEPAPGGGALLRLRLPAAPLEPTEGPLPATSSGLPLPATPP